MSTALALLVMLNNYMHDLATAVFGVSSFAAYLLVRRLRSEQNLEPLRPVVRGMFWVGVISFAWVLIFGGFRALAYVEYEWVQGAGEAQVTMLAVKHVILVGLVTLGLVALVRARALFKTSG